MDIPDTHEEVSCDSSSERCKSWFVIKEGKTYTRIGKTRLEMNDIIKTELTCSFGDLIVMTDTVGEYKVVTPLIFDVETPDDSSWEYLHTVQRAAGLPC